MTTRPYSNSSSSSARDYDYNLKLVLVGDLGVGKSTFLNTFIDGKYSQCVGHHNREIMEKLLQYNNKKVRLQIWDTAGQERYRSLTSSYYRGAHGCFIVFDVTNKTSFENVTRWRRDIQQYCDMDNIGTVLVGTKCHESNREVPCERAEELARTANIPYMEVSCERDLGSVEAVFTKMVDIVVSHNNPTHAASYRENRTLEKSAKKTWCSC